MISRPNVDSSESTFKRNQVDQALWQVFTSGRHGQTNAPSVFRTRIKRLLDMDRVTELSPSETTRVRYAFITDAPSGRGNEIRYTSFDVFVLLIGIELLDLGLKPADILFMLRHSRPELTIQYDKIVNLPLLDRQRISVDTVPEEWRESTSIKDSNFVDARLFMVFSKTDLQEIYGGIAKSEKNPIIEAPKFFKGIGKLTEDLDEMGLNYNKLIILELAERAQALAKALSDAPEIKRGR